MNKAPSEHQLIKLTTLLQLEHEVRHTSNTKELGFVAVNETHRLLPFHQAVMWRYNLAQRPRIEAVSNVADVDRDAPFVVWARDLFAHLARDAAARQSRDLAMADVPEKFHDGWSEWCPGHGLWCPFIAHDELIGGLWLTRAEPWQPAEITLLERAADAYAHAWSALMDRKRRSFTEQLRALLPSRRFQYIAAAVLVGILFFPVRVSVLAPAEIIPFEPALESAPTDGVIKTFHVEPNQAVTAGQLLFELDDTSIRNRHEVADKALAVARAAYLRAAQKAFADTESKSELALLKARVDEKAAELAYNADLLERSHVRARRDGVAVFSDPNDWIGRPVVTGEKVLTIADPEKVELEALVPVSDAINLEPGAEVRFFLNTAPTRPLRAELRQANYEAQAAPDGALVFRIKARLGEQTTTPRIGLKGTAKIFGERVVLIYYLLRRPLAALRQMVGL